MQVQTIFYHKGISLSEHLFLLRLDERIVVERPSKIEVSLRTVQSIIFLRYSD
nr:MAG TPA: hypothetical protein [Bacteriophage sp.]